ncbi:MAG: hypothetical protein KC493_04245 [Bacteriovoracaceae bacterium]|nr:hypothetical protein [Bacteriovoracaceae bacterium]
MLLLQGCSFFKKSSTNNLTKSNSKRIYDLEDKSGRFIVERENGYIKNKNQLILKRQVFSNDDPTKKPLERSIVISNPGKLKSLTVLRPFRSQYTVWFEKQKFFTEMLLDTKNKSLVVKMSSPEKQWNGTKNFPFPKGKGVYCFFSQVIDCASVTGFLNQAIGKQAGEMYFHIIWEGYPYFMEQYINTREEVFSRATLKYDGKTKNGFSRFTLEAGGQSIFYLLDSRAKIQKIFWVSQGFTQSYKGSKSN